MIHDPIKIVDSGFNHVRRCRHGWMLYNIHDQFIGRSLEKYGEFSEGEIALFQQLLGPGDVILDIGANIGAHTLFFAKHVTPQGHVYALEPQRLIFQSLCANMALNSITNATCLWAAAGDHTGWVKVPALDPEVGANFGGVGLGSQPAGESVPLLTIDGLSLSGCRLIKIDVEGMETDVLRGAQETIARHWPILYVENDRPERSDELVQWIIQCGYEPYWHTPLLFQADNFHRETENVFGAIASLNLLCVHPRHRLCMDGFQRVRSAEPRPLP